VFGFYLLKVTNDKPTRDWIISIFRAVGLAVLLISPLGAPLVGLIIIGGCDIPWEGAYQCSFPQPLLDYFLPFAILPAVWVGPFLAILWLMLAVGLLLGCLWFLGKAIWQLTMERL